MKSWLLVFTVLLVCNGIEGGSTKYDSKNKYHIHEDKNEAVAKQTSSVKNSNKSNGPAIGLYSLNMTKKSKHSQTKKTATHTKRKGKHKVSKLLKKFKNCMQVYRDANQCKKKNKYISKKAMIWPKKMLPALEKMLLNRLNGGGGDSGFDNYDNPTQSVDNNDFADNWDGFKPKHHSNHNKFNGMDVVPLLKMLKEKVGESSPYDSNGFAGAPSTQSGNKFLTKLLVSQALGKPDRGSVMKDMMQEFYLANGNDRSGEVAREAFNELMGHDNLIRANSEMEAENSDVNMGSNAQIGRMNLPNRVQNFAPQGGGGQGFGGSVVQAQELPNGKIAPMNQPIMGSMPNTQQMMPQTVNPTTRMLNSETSSNIPISSPVMQNPFPTRNTVMHDDPQSRPVGFSTNNDLVFEEEGENAARGIKSPPFATANVNFAENAMQLDSNYKSQPEINSEINSPDDAINMPHQSFGDGMAAVMPGQQVIAARRNDLPTKHKLYKTTGKAPMRSKDLPKPYDKTSKTKGH